MGRRCGSTTRWPPSSRVIGTVIRTQFASTAVHAGSASGGAHDGPSSPDSSTSADPAGRGASGGGAAARDGGEPPLKPNTNHREARQW